MNIKATLGLAGLVFFAVQVFETQSTTEDGFALIEAKIEAQEAQAADR